MFDIGGWEFLLIAILGIIIIGPKELPGAIRTVSMYMRRARELARDFQSGLEEVAREAELDKLTDDLKGIADPGGDIRRSVEETIDPDGELRDSMDFDRNWRDDDLAEMADGDADENRMLPPDLENEAREAAENAAEEVDSVNSDAESGPSQPAVKPDAKPGEA